VLTPAYHATRQRGFTIIELMVTGVVLAILLTIGLPSFNQFIVRNQVRASAEALQNGVQLARAEAVRLNAKVRFTLGAGTSSSWGVNVDSGGALVQESRASGEGGSASVTTTRTPANATQITFNGLGRVVANTDASATLTAVDVSVSGAPPNSTLRIQVSSPGGQVRICDPSVTGTTDTRRCL
jgi:type IV fimbrial biogenesis protein FimT